MKELVQVLLLVFIILGALYMVKVSIDGEMKGRMFMSADYQLFSLQRKYDGIVEGLSIAVRHHFSRAYDSCLSGCSSSDKSYISSYLSSYMEPRILQMNNSISRALSRIQQLGYTRYRYHITERKPRIVLGDPIVVGIPVYISIRTPQAELEGERIVWVDTGLNHSELRKNIMLRLAAEEKEKRMGRP